MRSGQNADDVIVEAHKIHKNSFGKFQFYKEWLQLKKWDIYRFILEQKVHMPRRGRPSKKLARLTPRRAVAAKRDQWMNMKAKSRLKGKEVTIQALDTFESFGDKLTLYAEMRDKAIDIDLQRLKLEKKKEARKQKKIELAGGEKHSDAAI
uniref:Uncharacterized protein n=1 Tax=Chenopodium quinoa TaxID=63459 RepID=A0A803MW06_CHEQI